MNGFQHSLVHELRDIAEKFNDKVCFQTQPVLSFSTFFGRIFTTVGVFWHKCWKFRICLQTRILPEDNRKPFKWHCCTKRNRFWKSGSAEISESPNFRSIFLFLRYRDFMMEMVSRNLLRAELGGKPGTFQLVKSYLKLKYPPDLQTGFEVRDPSHHFPLFKSWISLK